MEICFFIENGERLLFFQSLVVDVLVVCYGSLVLSAYREGKGGTKKKKKNNPQKALFFKSCIPAVTLSVLAEIHPALCPAEIKGYIWVITPGNGKSTLLPSSGEVQPPWQSWLAKPCEILPGDGRTPEVIPWRPLS